MADQTVAPKVVAMAVQKAGQMVLQKVAQTVL